MGGRVFLPLRPRARVVTCTGAQIGLRIGNALTVTVTVIPASSDQEVWGYIYIYKDQTSTFTTSSSTFLSSSSTFLSSSSSSNIQLPNSNSKSTPTPSHQTSTTHPPHPPSHFGSRLLSSNFKHSGSNQHRQSEVVATERRRLCHPPQKGLTDHRGLRFGDGNATLHSPSQNRHIHYFRAPRMSLRMCSKWAILSWPGTTLSARSVWFAAMKSG